MTKAAGRAPKRRPFGLNPLRERCPGRGRLLMSRVSTTMGTENATSALANLAAMARSRDSRDNLSGAWLPHHPSDR